MILKDEQVEQVLSADAARVDDEACQQRRTRIWEFGVNLHCSIIGTCLSTADLRHILIKLGIVHADAISAHELHNAGVMLASRRESGARLLQKALDRQHRNAIARSAKAKDPDALLTLWEESLKQGEIPGSYWAVLTHPLTTEAVVKRVFGDVHMLSHLVGSANRADIRRLRQLEQDNAALTAKADRQQRLLQDGFATRDQTIRKLNDMLGNRVSEQTERPSGSSGREDETIEHLIRDLQRRLAQQTARADRLERRSQELSSNLQACERSLQTARAELDAARLELAAAERHLEALLDEARSDPDVQLDLSGLTVLYVGGRANQIPRMKELVERGGGHFLHHDGGLEHSAALLTSLIRRADQVSFPVDCISHDAVITIKKLCRQARTPYCPLRTASLACLLSALRSAHPPAAKGVAAE